MLQIVTQDTCDPRLANIRALRAQAWASFHPGASVLQDHIDPTDKGAIQWVVLYGGVLVASARLSVHSRIEDVPEAEIFLPVFKRIPAPPFGSINRLAVHPQYRGTGLARVLDTIRLKTAWELGCQSILAETISGPRRIDQLLDLGFEIVGTSKPDRMQSAVTRGEARPVVLVLHRHATRHARGSS